MPERQPNPPQKRETRARLLVRAVLAAKSVQAMAMILCIHIAAETPRLFPWTA